MRRRIISVAVLIIATGFTAPNAVSTQKRNVDFQMSLHQKIENEIFNLRRNLGMNLPSLAKVKLIKMSEIEIQSLRAKSHRQAEGDEIYFDQLVAVLGEIPKAEPFNRQNCDSVKTTLMTHFEPTAQPGKIQGIALQSGLILMRQLCR